MGVIQGRNVRVFQLLQGSLRIIGRGVLGQEGGELECFSLNLPFVLYLSFVKEEMLKNF